MHLARILLISLFSVGGALGQTATQSPQPAQSSEPNSAPSQHVQQANPPAAPAKSSAHKTQKKKSVPCSNSQKAGSTGDDAAAKPCSPPKKVVRNGGSEEPAIQLVGGATHDTVSQQRSTEQITAATEDNLKKLAGRQLTSSQQDMLNQVKQFMDQSKTAVAAGDLERGHNLAEKAHLLSEDLLKP